VVERASNQVRRCGHVQRCKKRQTEEYTGFVRTGRLEEFLNRLSPAEIQAEARPTIQAEKRRGDSKLDGPEGVQREPRDTEMGAVLDEPGRPRNVLHTLWFRLRHGVHHTIP